MAFSLLQNIAQKALDTAGSFASGAINYLSKNPINPTMMANPAVGILTSKPAQDVGASIGRVLQKTPDTTIPAQKPLFKTNTPLDLLFDNPVTQAQGAAGEFVTSLPGEFVRSWGRTMERVNTEEGRKKIAEGGKQVPGQVGDIFTKKGKRMESLGKLFENPAVEDALNVSDIFTLGVGSLIKTPAKQGIKTGVKTALKEGTEEIVETATKKAPQTILKETAEKTPTKIAKTTKLAAEDPQNIKLAQDYLAKNRPPIPEQPLLSDTDLAMKALERSRGVPQSAAEQVASVADDILQPVTKETKQLFQKGTDIAKKWINTREGFTNWRAGDIKKTPGLTQFDKEGMDAILDLQKGGNPGRYGEIKQFTDGLYELEEKAGILRPDQYRQHYLPQMWDNTPEEIDEIFKKTAGGKPGFTKSRLFEDYQKGIEAGLTPRYTQMSDLLESRFRTAQRALADKDLVDNLLTSGQGATLDKAKPGWVKVDLSHEGKAIAVDPQTAKIINNYLGEGNALLQKTAEFVSNAKQTILSAGIPKTGWNFHTGVNVPARRMAIGKNPFSAVVDSVIWNSKPSSALHYIENVVPKEVTDGLLKAGLSISRSVDDAGYGFKPRGGDSLYAKGVNWFDKMFSEAAFDKVLPAHKLKIGWETYQNALKKGATQDEAFKIAAQVSNEVFGGINTSALGRSKDMQNLFRTLALAPDWLESNVRIAGRTGGLLNPKNWSDPAFAPYKRFAINAASMYGTMAITNKALSGHWPWENGPGQEFNLATGTFDERGRERMVPAFGTAFDFIRLPLTVISSVAGNDPQQAINIIKNRLSPPASAVAAVLSNQDYRGRELFSDENSPMQNIGALAGQVGTAVGVPSQVTNALTFMRGESTPEELLAGLLEAPLRYRGGAKTPSQRETAANLQEAGATNEDINAAFDKSGSYDTGGGGGLLGGLFGGGNDYKTMGTTADGKPMKFKSPKEKKAFDESIDNALANGATDIPEGAIITRFFDGEKYDKSKKSGQKEILDKMLDVANDEYLLPEQKAAIANAAGIDPIDLNYYRSASLDQTERLEGLIAYAADPANSENRQEFLENLIMGKRSVGGKSLFSTQMYDYLYDQGLITKEEKALITASKYDSLFDKFYMDRDYKGGGGGGGASASKVKSYINSINSIFKNTFKTKKGKSAFEASEKDFADIEAPKLNLPKLSKKGGSPNGWFTA